MVDIQDRRYLAQCTQQLSSSSLAELLDLLLMRHPLEVVERKGGESYHIDFGILSSLAYSDAREFIKKALGDDDDSSLGENEKQVINSISSFPPTHHTQQEDEHRAANTITSPGSSAKLQVQTTNRSNLESIPAPPSEVQGSASSKHLLSASPGKEAARLKRVRVMTPSPEHNGKTEESRYYNGERVWRHSTNDLEFNFHGVNVSLLSLLTNTKRPWRCLTCDKTFVSKDKIVNHVQQHSGEKIHECPMCKGRFSSKHYLKDHQKRVHLFHCHYCDAVFDAFSELHDHSEQMHPKQTALKTCSCKKGCLNSRCSCHKNGLNCNPECLCLDCNNMT